MTGPRTARRFPAGRPRAAGWPAASAAARTSAGRRALPPAGRPARPPVPSAAAGVRRSVPVAWGRRPSRRPARVATACSRRRAGPRGPASGARGRAFAAKGRQDAQAARRAPPAMLDRGLSRFLCQPRGTVPFSGRRFASLPENRDSPLDRATEFRRHCSWRLAPGKNIVRRRRRLCRRAAADRADAHGLVEERTQGPPPPPQLDAVRLLPDRHGVRIEGRLAAGPPPLEDRHAEVVVSVAQQEVVHRQVDLAASGGQPAEVVMLRFVAVPGSGRRRRRCA